MIIAAYDQTAQGSALQPQTGASDADLAQAILATLLYSDLFDYPLTPNEIAIYLIGAQEGPLAIAAALREHPLLLEQVAERDGYYFLNGRSEVVELRRGREARSARLWGRARNYVRWLGHVPFVRMICVTGALAMDNVGSNEDIDLLVITDPGRVWIARRFMVLAVRLSRLLGDELCPNYLLAADALALPDRDLFTAHELAQMVPLYGHDTYRQMLLSNSWFRTLLPSGGRGGQPQPATGGADRSLPRRLVERLLRHPIFDRWESTELARMRSLVSTGTTGEVGFDEHLCKGHVGLYRQNVLLRLDERLAEHGIPPTFVPAQTLN